MDFNKHRPRIEPAQNHALKHKGAAVSDQVNTVCTQSARSYARYASIDSLF